MKLTVHGTTMSPWVRRILLALEEKGLEYDTVNVVPLGDPDPEFLKISPLGKVPVLEVDGRFLPDSLAGCAFLDSAHPNPSLFPEDGWQRAWMLWLCDFLATGLFTKVEAPLFIQRLVNPNFFKLEPDQSIIDQAFEEMPAVFDYLEAQLDGGKPFLLGEAFSLADLTAGSIFINLRHAGEEVDAARWPRLADFVSRIHARPSFERILSVEKNAIGAVSPLFAA
ncbi:MAG: glutathione S-transferase family protein [Pseudomonadota bacterium]